jgi:hypothetical protein
MVTGPLAPTGHLSQRAGVVKVGSLPVHRLRSDVATGLLPQQGQFPQHGGVAKVGSLHGQSLGTGVVTGPLPPANELPHGVGLGRIAAGQDGQPGKELSERQACTGLANDVPAAQGL